MSGVERTESLVESAAEISDGGAPSATGAAEPEREAWGTRVSFLLAAIGSAIGTGNVWRFPYLCYAYGGGGFLIPYFCSLFILGIPLMLLELALGQFRQKGFVECMMEVHVGLSGLAWATVINSFLSCTFYNVIMAWSLVYLVNCFSLPWVDPNSVPSKAAFLEGLPAGSSWTGCGCGQLDPATCSCDEWMVDPSTFTPDPCSPLLAVNETIVTQCDDALSTMGHCLPEEMGATYYVNSAPAGLEDGFKRSGMRRLEVGKVSPAETYFYDVVLRKSADITTGYSVQLSTLFSLALIWVCVYFCIFKGVESAGLVVYLTVPLPVLILFILVFRGITLDDAAIGLRAFITPNFDVLWDPTIWQTAVSQIFFSISAAMGIMTSYASHNPKNQDVVFDAVIICLANSFFSMVAGVAVFSVLGFMAGSDQTCIDNVAEGGPGLAFIVFPTALGMMPWSSFFSILFFLMLLALGIDSAFSMVEALNTAWLEVLPPKGSPPQPAPKGQPAIITTLLAVPHERVPVYLCILGWVCGIIFCTDAGYYWLDVCNKYIIFTLTLVGCVECVGLTWIREAQGKFLAADIESMIGRPINPAWHFIWKWVCPPILGLLFLSSMGLELYHMADVDYPAPVIVFGWALALLPTLVLSMYFIDKEVNLAIEDGGAIAVPAGAGGSDIVMEEVPPSGPGGAYSKEV